MILYPQGRPCLLPLHGYVSEPRALYSYRAYNRKGAVRPLFHIDPEMALLSGGLLSLMALPLSRRVNCEPALNSAPPKWDVASAPRAGRILGRQLELDRVKCALGQYSVQSKAWVSNPIGRTARSSTLIKDRLILTSEPRFRRRIVSERLSTQ